MKLQSRFMNDMDLYPNIGVHLLFNILLHVCDQQIIKEW